MYEIDEVDMFFHELAYYIEDTTVLATYTAMCEESRRKYRERIVITTCMAQAPKRNYGISMASVRSFVGEVLAVMEARAELDKEKEGEGYDES